MATTPIIQARRQDRFKNNNNNDRISDNKNIVARNNYYASLLVRDFSQFFFR